MKNFVNKAWLEENIDNDDLIILDTRADLNDPEKGLELYKESHIKGAQFVSLEQVMTGDLAIHGGRHPIPDMDIFINDMKDLGIHDDSVVIIYDDGDLFGAGRLWWLLKYIGKDMLYILEGGFDQWVKNGGETTKEISPNKRSKSLSLKINEQLKVDMEYVRDSIGKEKTRIIDARAYERYIGKVEPLDKIPGRIPSAVNLPWKSLVEKSIDKEKLSQCLKPLGDYEEIIVYCGSGVSGAVPFVLMDEIGLEPKLYAGSYSDWISYEDNKVEIGEGSKICIES